MADTDALLPYVPNPYPTIPGGEPIFVTEELSDVKRSIDKLIAVLVLLEARIEALEP